MASHSGLRETNPKPSSCLTNMECRMPFAVKPYNDLGVEVKGRAWKKKKKYNNTVVAETVFR